MSSSIFAIIGHVDHGKTSIIKSLTNKDLDTLQLEKDRGITINLGFTDIEIKNKTISIVDVPGHEKYIKNMIAGLSGVDNFILVISAKDGIKEQTIEHLQIMDYLDIPNCIIALNKVDLVDKETVEIRKNEIKDFIKDTRYSKSEIVELSAKNNIGLEKLKINILKLANIKQYKKIYPALINIDRSFTVKGQGTVVTGALMGSSVKCNDEIYIYPKKIKTTIRNIQNHNKNLKSIKPGNRVAINLRDINKKEVNRGDIILKDKNYSIGNRALGIIKFSEKEIKILKNGNYILYIGSLEINVQSRILDYKYDIIENINIGLIEIKSQKDILSFKNEKFILRNQDKTKTICGGQIIDPLMDYRFGKYKNKYNFYDLTNDNKYIQMKIDRYSHIYPTEDYIKNRSNILTENFNEIIQLLKDKNEIISIDNVLISREFYEKYKYDLYKKIEILSLSLSEYKTFSLEKIYSKYFIKSPKKIYNMAIKNLLEDGYIFTYKDRITNYKNSFKLSMNDKKIVDLIMKEYKDNNLKPKNMKDLFEDKDFNKVNDIIFYLLSMDYLIELSENIYLNKEALNKAKNIVIDYLNKNKSITIAEAKDQFATSRKMTIAILEYLDNAKITKRYENVRCLYN